MDTVMFAVAIDWAYHARNLIILLVATIVLAGWLLTMGTDYTHR